MFNLDISDSCTYSLRLLLELISADLGVAGLTENKANSANPAELELGLSWAELGKKYGLLPYKGWGEYPPTKLFLFFSKLKMSKGGGNKIMDFYQAQRSSIPAPALLDWLC